MYVHELKKILEDVPDNYVILMENRIDGQVIEWDNFKNKTECVGYTIHNDIEFKDHMWNDEKNEPRITTTYRQLGGSLTFFNKNKGWGE